LNLIFPTKSLRTERGDEKPERKWTSVGKLQKLLVGRLTPKLGGINDLENGWTNPNREGMKKYNEVTFRKLHSDIKFS